MPIDATVGGVASNSYETLAEATTYFTTARLPIQEWDDADSQEILLIMATRIIEMMLSGHKQLSRSTAGDFYITSPQWTGSPATTTQRLAWPRKGMFDRNGNAIPTNVIPQDLKDALSEMAGQLAKGDRTLDNDVMVQGITAVRAGSVSVNFKDDIRAYVIPDAVWNLMPDSWYTDEIIEPAVRAQLDVIS